MLGIVCTTFSSGSNAPRSAAERVQPMPSGTPSATAAATEPATSARCRIASLRNVSARTAYSCITDSPSQKPP